jgi:hypothetical protein
MGQNDLSHEPCHLVVPRPKQFSELMVRLAQTVHLSCTETNTISEEKEVKFQMTHVIGSSKMISEPMARSTQTVHLSCIKIRTISKQTEMSFQFSLVTEEYHRVRVHLSCTDTNTVSKW